MQIVKSNFLLEALGGKSFTCSDGYEMTNSSEIKDSHKNFYFLQNQGKINERTRKDLFKTCDSNWTSACRVESKVVVLTKGPRLSSPCLGFQDKFAMRNSIHKWTFPCDNMSPYILY